MSFNLNITVMPEDYRLPRHAVIATMPDGTVIVLGIADSSAEAHTIANNITLGSS